MNFNLHFFFLVLVSPLFSGVERFLEPVILSGNNHEKKNTKSAFFRSTSFNNVYNQLEVEDTRSKQINAGQIEHLLSEALKHRYQVSGNVVATLASSWTDLESSSKVLLKIKDCSPDDLTSSCFVRFSLWESGKKIGDFSSPLRIAHLEEVYFSKTALPRGRVLTKNDFFAKNVDVLKNHANSVPYNTNLSGYELQTNLNASSPIKWSYLSKATVIRKGQVVDVFASGNGIYVTMKGLALEDGVLDSFVRIKNLSSEKEFHAKVLSENSVKVHL